MMCMRGASSSTLFASHLGRCRDYLRLIAAVLQDKRTVLGGLRWVEL